MWPWRRARFGLGICSSKVLASSASAFKMIGLGSWGLGGLGVGHHLLLRQKLFLLSGLSKLCGTCPGTKKLQGGEWPWMYLERRQWTGFAENHVHGSLVLQHFRQVHGLFKPNLCSSFLSRDVLKAGRPESCRHLDKICTSAGIKLRISADAAKQPLALLNWPSVEPRRGAKERVRPVANAPRASSGPGTGHACRNQSQGTV